MKTKLWLLLAAALLFTPLAFATDTRTVNTVVTTQPADAPESITTVPAVPGVPAPIPGEEQSPWQGVVAMIVTALLAALTWLSHKAAEFFSKKIEDVRTSENTGWYAMAFSLAGIAVKYAETEYGPNTNEGEKKRELAINWLMDRLRALDPKIDSHIKRDDVAAFIDAAYHDVFVAVSPLGKTPR